MLRDIHNRTIDYDHASIKMQQREVMRTEYIVDGVSYTNFGEASRAQDKLILRRYLTDMGYASYDVSDIIEGICKHFKLQLREE